MSLFRLLKITNVSLRFRLDEFLLAHDSVRGWRLALAPFVFWRRIEQPRAVRLRLALEALGPIFVKFGQILSTRRDLLPPDVADELTMLQDRVAPFPESVARAAIESALGAPISARFASFDGTPLASASIAQVHAATLPDGRDVVVKVLRPDIDERVGADVELLHAIASSVERFHPNADKIRPRDVVVEIETTLTNELDLMREGA